MKTQPLRFIFTDRRDNGDHVDYFRHEDGRCVVAVNGRVEMDGHEDGSPYAVIALDRIDVDGRRASDEEADELTDIVRDALGGFDWGPG